MIATGGTWDPDDRHHYFLASNHQQLSMALPIHPWLLVAVNELDDAEEQPQLQELIDAGARILLDSGIFWLTNEHKRKHDITMDEALGLPPSEVDGFDWLWERYVKIVTRYGNACWGYIELDQGGRDRKRETRAELHALGLNPMPVYHPLNDGAEYFEELAAGYDRLCMGNIVQANPATRVRLLHTLWERHRHYPDLWVHVLGLTPNEWLNGFPVDSADSSSWLTNVRWSAAWRVSSMLKRFTAMPLHMRYRLGDKQSYPKAIELAAVSESLDALGWRHWLEEEVQDTFALPAYPAP